MTSSVLDSLENCQARGNMKEIVPRVDVEKREMSERSGDGEITGRVMRSESSL